jgi:signal transduction histidine kinase
MTRVLVVEDHPVMSTAIATGLRREGMAVDNAVRHNITGGTVEITTAAGGCVSISNTGAVIHPAEVERPFQPFQRHGTDRTHHARGHELGLAIVAAIADAHGAALTAHARPPARWAARA